MTNDEILASIEVYDFVEGREVNRRPAYPLIRMRVDMVRAMGSLRSAAQQAAKGFRELADSIGSR